MIRCLIVDDEPLAHQVLERYIAQTPGFTVAGKCRNAVEAFEFVNTQAVDLMFLDIEMPLVNGIQFLKSATKAPKTILTTAFKEYAYEGYELHVIDYLLKPFSYERFAKAVEKFNQANMPVTATEEEKFLLIKDHKGLIKVNQKEILYIEGCKDYVKIALPGKAHLMHKTMKDMQECLGEKFVRVHRSFIVSANHIKIIKSEHVILSNGSQIPIGNLYKQQVLDYFKK